MNKKATKELYDFMVKKELNVRAECHKRNMEEKKIKDNDFWGLKTIHTHSLNFENLWNTLRNKLKDALDKEVAQK